MDEYINSDPKRSAMEVATLLVVTAGALYLLKIAGFRFAVSGGVG